METAYRINYLKQERSPYYDRPRNARSHGGFIKTYHNKLDSMEIKLSEMQVQIDILRLDMKTSERSIRKDIRALYDGIDTLVEVLETKGILPKAK